MSDEPAKLIDTTIIHKEIEPGIINEEMIQKCIIEQGYQGEAGRLAREEPIRYEKVTKIFLEHFNLLKIDHLWILPNLTKLSLNFNKLDRIENLDALVNLKELDLSFNFIEKIENLDQLVKLEVLTLYSNSIRKLENLDSLTNLIIFSIGFNQIDTLDGIERLRFFKTLRSLNLEDNPIARDPEYSLRQYIATFLPQLKYYNYIYIKDAERETGKEKYHRQLRDLQEHEKDEVAAREKARKEKEDEIRLSDAFVEFLNEHQLFDSLFVNDPDGDAMLLIGDEATDLVEKYRVEAFYITQRIYKLGLERHKIRLNEITLFEKCVMDAKISAQKEGQFLVDQYLEEKLKYSAVIVDLQKSVEENNRKADESEGVETEEDDPDQILHDLEVDMINTLDEVWKMLMAIEINLFERVEEANNSFGHTITDMMNEFIEAAQSNFVQLRDAECYFCDALQEAVSRYITFKMSTKTDDTIPVELKECMEDKEAISNLIAGMRDHHLLVVDTREDRMVKRARGWINDLVTNMNDEEIKRNRNKVMEINYFLDQQREEFEKMIRDQFDEED